MFDEFGFVDAFGGGGADIAPIAFDPAPIADTAWTPSLDSSMLSPDMAMGGAGGFDSGLGDVVSALADAGRFDLIPPVLEAATGSDGLSMMPESLAPVSQASMPEAAPLDTPTLMALMSPTVPEANPWIAPWSPMGDIGKFDPKPSPLVINPEQQFSAEALSGLERGLQPPQELGLGAANAFEMGSQPPQMGAQSFDEGGFSLPSLQHNDGGPTGTQGSTDTAPDFNWVFGGQPDIPQDTFGDRFGNWRQSLTAPSQVVADHFINPMGAQSFDEGGFNVSPFEHNDGTPVGSIGETSQYTQVPLPMPRPYAYANSNAVRSYPVTHNLESRIADTATNVYGPGSRGVIFSGGQEKPFRDPLTGKMSSTRHNLDAEGRGQAADVKFYDRQGQLITNPKEAGQYWTSQGWGSAAPGMPGGGIHLDQHTGRAPTWSYPGTTPDQRAAVQQGIAGNAPRLAYQPEGGSVAEVAPAQHAITDAVKDANRDFASNASNDPGKPMEVYKQAIGKIESGNKYDKLGPETKDGDRALGRYGVMGKNVAKWSKDATGESYTKEEFLENKDGVQDKVFEHRFGKYVDKYGPRDAAKAWFAGERGMKNDNAKDQLGTSVAKYAEKFTKLAGEPTAVSGDQNVTTYSDGTKIPNDALPKNAQLREANLGQRKMTDFPLPQIFGGNGQGGGQMPAILGGPSFWNNPGNMAALELIVNSVSRAAPIHGLAESARHDQQYAEQQASKQAVYQAAIAAGFSPKEAAVYASNPKALEMAYGLKQDQEARKNAEGLFGPSSSQSTPSAPASPAPSMLSPTPMQNQPGIQSAAPPAQKPAGILGMSLDQLYKIAGSGMRLPEDTKKLIHERIKQLGATTDDIKEYEYHKAQGGEGTLEQWVQRKRHGGGEYGLNPIWGTGADGKPAIAQLGKGGKAVKSEMPPGFQVGKDPIKIDGGTHWILLDPVSRQPIGQYSKNLGAAEAEKAEGEALGKAKVALPAAETTARRSFRMLDELEKHAGLGDAVGFIAGRFPALTPKGQDARERIEQIDAMVFGDAVEVMRGLGALTDREGPRITAARARLKTAKSEEDFRSALRDVREVFQDGIENMRKKAGITTPSAPFSSPAVPPPPPGFQLVR